MSTLQRNIRGRDYSFGVIPPIEAIEVEVAVARVIGEPVFKALMEIDKDKSGDKEDKKKKFNATAAMAIGMMTSRMEAKDLIRTMETVFTYVSCDGARISINSTFVGRNKELWEVFFEALKHNFSDFFPESLSDSLPSMLHRG